MALGRSNSFKRQQTPASKWVNVCQLQQFQTFCTNEMKYDGLVAPGYWKQALETNILSKLLTEAVTFFLSPSPLLPASLSSLSCPVHSILKRLSLHCSPTKSHGIDQLVSQRNWHHLLNEKTRGGGLTMPFRNGGGRLRDGLVGEVEACVPGGPLHGGHWRCLHIWSHRYRGFADRIGLWHSGGDYEPLYGQHRGGEP